MNEKEWQGADLVFDLDADHIDGAEKMGLEEMLAAVKVEFKKLLDSYLLGDFGFDESDIQIVFSGGRGYHAHVRDERVLKLDSHMRRDLVDFITATGLDDDWLIRKKPYDVKKYKEHVNVKYIKYLPNVSDAGWRGKVAREVDHLLVKSEEKGKDYFIEILTSHKGIGMKRAEKMWEDLFVGEPGKRGVDILRSKRTGFAEEILLTVFTDYSKVKLSINLSGETDEPVTSDIKRLIRLPGSLHGKTGFVVRLLDLESLDDFEPLRDAVWEGLTDEPVKVTGKEDFDINLKDENFKIEKGVETELPEFAALFLLCQKRCEITIG